MATQNSIGSNKPIEVSFGGIGAATLTDHGVLVGSGTSAVTALTVGTNGQLLIGSTGADPVFANLTSTGGTISITEGAGTLNLEAVGGTGAQNTHTISPSGGDYTTIQAALTANPTANSLFLVYPGTYSGDTITFTANNQSVIGVGEPETQVISAASAKIVDFAAFTGCMISNITCTITGATAALIDTIVGSTGSLDVNKCIFNVTNSSHTGANQPACLRITGAGSVDVMRSVFNYTNNVAAAGQVKVAVSLGAGSYLKIVHSEATVGCTGASTGSAFVYSPTTGELEMIDCQISVTDDTGGLVDGIYYDGTAPGLVQNCSITVVGGAANTGAAIQLIGSSTMRSLYNEINVTDSGGISYSFRVAAATELVSKFDDITAADGVDEAGTFTQVSSDGDGNLTASGNLVSNYVATSAVQFDDDGVMSTQVNASDYYNISAYNTNTTSDVAFFTLTAGDPPTGDLSTSVTMGSNAIYYATGTDVPVTDGGTGASTLTDHGVLVGSGTAAVTALAVGSTGEVLIGNTGADPSWSSTATVTTLNATTFDTNVAAAAVTLSGTSLTADGTDSDIDINITAKGTGQVIIDDLQLTTDLAVTEGGTGASSLTDHGVLVGSGTGAVTALSVGTNGQVLVGSTGADPVFATLASADNSIDFTTGAGTLDLSVSGTVSINAQTGTSYTPVIGDAGKLVTLDNAAAITLTIPPNSSVAYDTGTTIAFAQKGAGTVTFAPGSGVTISSRGSALDTAGQYAMASVVKISTDLWYLSGDIS